MNVCKILLILIQYKYWLYIFFRLDENSQQEETKPTGQRGDNIEAIQENEKDVEGKDKLQEDNSNQPDHNQR